MTSSCYSNMGFSITDLVTSSCYSREKFVFFKAQFFPNRKIQTDLVLFSCFQCHEHVTNLVRASKNPPQVRFVNHLIFDQNRTALILPNSKLSFQGWRSWRVDIGGALSVVHVAIIHSVSHRFPELALTLLPEEIVVGTLGFLDAKGTAMNYWI